VSDILSKTMF